MLVPIKSPLFVSVAFKNAIGFPTGSLVYSFTSANKSSRILKSLQKLKPLHARQTENVYSKTTSVVKKACLRLKALLFPSVPLINKQKG